MEHCLYHKDEKLFHKSHGNNLTTLSNWLPVTLLNIDFKILAKTIAKRIEPVLPKLIHPDQTGFIKGRFIGQKVRLLNDLMQYTDDQKIPEILMFTDFEKAFDTIEWSFYSKCT